MSNIGQTAVRIVPAAFTGTVALIQGELVVLMNANEDGMMCLEPSFDKLFGSYGDLTSSRLQDAAFSVCEPSSGNFQRYTLKTLDGSNDFVLRPRYYVSSSLLNSMPGEELKS